MVYFGDFITLYSISVFVKPKGYVGKSCEAYEFPVSNAKCSPNSFVELHVTS